MLLLDIEKALPDLLVQRFTGGAGRQEDLGVKDQDQAGEESLAQRIVP